MLRRNISLTASVTHANHLPGLSHARTVVSILERARPLNGEVIRQNSADMNPVKRRTVGFVDVKFGANVTVIEPTNLYGCDIGDDTFIGPFVEIQKGATIGKRCRIQSHSFICELVTIGDDCFISHGAMFVNDLFVTADLRESRSFGAQLNLVTTSVSEPTPLSCR